MNLLCPFSPIYMGKEGGGCRPARPGELRSPKRAGLLPPEGTAFCWNILEGPSGSDFYLHTPIY